MDNLNLLLGKVVLTTGLCTLIALGAYGLVAILMGLQRMVQGRDIY